MHNNIIYVHINKQNNKIYIGQTYQKPELRWGKNGSGYQKNEKFWNAIKKYGWDNFEHIILFEYLTDEQANLIEIFLIDKYDSIKNGYNISKGGKKIPDKEAFKRNLHNGLKKRWEDASVREAYGDKMKEFYSSLSEEEKFHLYDNRRGVYHPKSKAVICLETGAEFESLTSAAIWAGMAPASAGNISAQIRGTKKSAGKHPITGQPLHWRFKNQAKENEVDIIEKAPKSKKKKVINLETKKVFNSLKEAALWCNGDSSGISRSCKSHGKRGSGKMPEDKTIVLHWNYYEEK